MKPTGVPGTAVSSTLQKQSSLALFLPFMILSLSLANSAQLLLPFLRALFFFYEDLFSHAHRKGSWKTFFCVTYSKVTKGKKLLQPRLVNMPVRALANFWSIYCVRTANKTSPEAELSGTLMIRLQQSFPNKTFFSFFAKECSKNEILYWLSAVPLENGNLKSL